MTHLETITRELFGDEAERLLEARAIVPLIDAKRPKAAITGWPEGFDPTVEIRFHSLGLLVGPKSGITVWDVDRQDLTPPVEPNVTTLKGYHVYTAHDGEARRIGLLPKVDLLGVNGYAIFYSKDRKFHHPNLTDTSRMLDWLDLSPMSLLQGSKEGQNEGKYEGYEEGYYNWLLTHGYELDLEAIERGYVALMSQANEGSRNDTLYRFARESLRCGIDTTALEQAALNGGLPQDEVSSTVDSAKADIEMHLSSTVYDHVTIWRDTVWGAVPAYSHPVIDALARRAIELNDHAPFFPQDRIVEYLLASGIDRTQQAVSKTLGSLHRDYGAIRVIDLGRQPDGRLNPRAYRLCIDGQPISEVLR